MYKWNFDPKYGFENTLKNPLAEINAWHMKRQNNGGHPKQQAGRNKSKAINIPSNNDESSELEALSTNNKAKNKKQKKISSTKKTSTTTTRSSSTKNNKNNSSSIAANINVGTKTQLDSRNKNGSKQTAVAKNATNNTTIHIDVAEDFDILSDGDSSVSSITNQLPSSKRRNDPVLYKEQPSVGKNPVTTNSVTRNEDCSSGSNNKAVFDMLTQISGKLNTVVQQVALNKEEFNEFRLSQQRYSEELHNNNNSNKSKPPRNNNDDDAYNPDQTHHNDENSPPSNRRKRLFAAYEQSHHNNHNRYCCREEIRDRTSISSSSAFSNHHVGKTIRGNPVSNSHKCYHRGQSRGPSRYDKYLRAMREEHLYAAYAKSFEEGEDEEEIVDYF